MPGLIDVDERMAADFAREHPAVAARLLEAHPPTETAEFFSKVGLDLAAAVLPSMIAGYAGDCLAAFDPEQAREVIESMRTEAGVAVLRAVDEPVREALLGVLPPSRRDALASLTRHRKGVAGAIMEPLAFVLPNDVRVDEALERVTASVAEVDSYIYVVDRDGRLVGVVTAAELVNARRDATVASVAISEPLCVEAATTDRALVGHVGWRRFHALPVVDENGVLIGRVRHAVLQLMREKVTDQTVTPGALKVALSLTDLCFRGATTLMGGTGRRSRMDRSAGEDGGAS